MTRSWGSAESNPESKTVLGYLGAYPSGGGGCIAIYALYRYVPLWSVWFSSSLLWDGVYKSESLGLEEGHFPFKLINWLKILV